MVQGNSQLETVEEEFMILKTNAEICTAWLEPKVEIKMCAFRYLGSILQKDGDIDEDVRHRISAGWLKMASSFWCPLWQEGATKAKR